MSKYQTDKCVHTNAVLVITTHKMKHEFLAWYSGIGILIALVLNISMVLLLSHYVS